MRFSVFETAIKNLSPLPTEGVGARLTFALDVKEPFAQLEIPAERWPESSEALAALAIYLQEQGFHVPYMKPHTKHYHSPGYLISVYGPGDMEHRVVISCTTGSDWVKILRYGIHSIPVSDQMRVKYKLADPDSFPKIAARVRELLDAA
jgi:hypothetical protein